MLRTFIFVLCFCGVSTLQAQYTFTGTIADCQTRHPLSGATVELASLKKVYKPIPRGGSLSLTFRRGFIISM